MLAEIKRQMQRGGMIGTPEERERFFRYLQVLAPRPDPVLILAASRRRREFMARALHAFGPEGEGGQFQVQEPAPAQPTREAAAVLESAWRRSLGGTLFIDRLDEFEGPLAAELAGLCRQALPPAERRGQPVLPATVPRLVFGRQAGKGAEPRRVSAAAARLERFIHPVRVDMRRLGGAVEPATPSAEATAARPDWREELERWLGRIWSAGGGTPKHGLLRQLMERADLELAEMALAESGGKRRRAAELLGISAATLSRRLNSGKGGG